MEKEEKKDNEIKNIKYNNNNIPKKIKERKLNYEEQEQNKFSNIDCILGDTNKIENESIVIFKIT